MNRLSEVVLLCCLFVDESTIADVSLFVLI
jgi:hypothetical protein